MSGQGPTGESHKLYYQMLADYYSRLLKAKDEGSYVAAHTLFFPVEALYAMDIVPMHTELTSWMTALFSGSCSDLLSASSQVGLAPEICSPYRVLAGALASGSLPHPNVVLWSNLICDNASKCGDLIMDMTQCQGFFMDGPFRQTEQENEYLKKELEEMIAYLEEQSGHKVDRGKLRESIEHTDRQIQLFREIDELRRISPSPFPPQDFLKLFTVDCLFAGRPEATQYLETFRKELLQIVEENKGKPNPERFRIMDIHMPPVLALGAIEKMSLEHGAVSVADPFFCTWGEGRLDPDQPLESIVKKIYLNPVMEMHGPLDERVIKKAVDCAQKHKVDGAIHYAHVGCRQGAALIKVIKDALAEIDVPVLVIDCDIIDITVAPQEEICQHLEQFFELLEER